MNTRQNRWYAGLTQWRNWSLPMKLVAVVLVPVVFAVGLGVVQIQRQVANADAYRSLVEHVEAKHQLQPLLTGLQRERSRAVELLSGATDDPSALRKNAAAVDGRVADVAHVLGAVRSAGRDAAAQYHKVREKLAGLPALRRNVLTSTIDPVTAVRSYNDIVGSLLALERAVVSGISNAKVADTADAVHEAATAAEEMRIQDALVTAGLTNGWSPQLLDALTNSRVRLRDRLAELRAAATPPQERRYERTTSGAQLEAREQQLDALLQAAASASGESASDEESSDTIGLAAWQRLSQPTISTMTRFNVDLSAELADTAAALKDRASDAAGRDSVILLSALILAAGGMFVITRQLLGSLGTLRRSALNAANQGLPDAVAQVRSGEDAEAAAPPVPVDTTEEIGQVARAFDEVNQQALRLAAEQASLHHGYSESFVGVSRRSQSLLEHQLRLFEGLEQDEEDPDQLARLFQLDHLATRMRRNNENLMVLSGRDLARRFAKPTELADVLRAAVSEIEQYPRVVVQPPPNVELLGHAASDLVRLLAELLDNAANFSAPETSVTVSSHQVEDGSLLVDVLDEGIGMGHRDIDDANHRLSRVDESDLAVSRRMGHFVVARLAVRHGISVRLHGGSDVEGLRASVSIPAAHVASGEVPRQPGPVNGSRMSDFPQHDPAASRGFAPAAPQQASHAAEFRRSGLDEGPTGNLFVPPVDLPPQSQPNAADVAPDLPADAEEPHPDVWEQQGGRSTPQWFHPTELDAQYQAATDAPQDDHRLPGGDIAPRPQPSSEHATSATSKPSGLTAGGLPRRGSQRSQGVGAREDTRARMSGTEAAAGTDEPPRRTSASPEARSRQEVSRRLADMQGGLRFPSSDAEGQDAAQRGGGSGWTFATDEAGRQAEEAVTRSPTSYTDSGLPRRTPKARLAPGSARPEGAGSESRAGDQFQRNPEQLRGRLSDFQSGVRRGRHRAPDEG